MPSLVEGVFLCAVRSRPLGVRALRESLEANDPSARIIAIISPDDPELAAVLAELSSAWTVLEAPAEATTVMKANLAFATFPDEAFYGFLANDLTWTRKGLLEELAAKVPPFGLSYCADSIHNASLATHPCADGELLRAQGWCFFPESKHNGVDCYMQDVATALGGICYVEGPGFWHNHPSAGRTQTDAVYDLVNSYGEADRAAWQKWYGAGEKERVIQRVRETALGCS